MTKRKKKLVGLDKFATEASGEFYRGAPGYEAGPWLIYPIGNIGYGHGSVEVVKVDKKKKTITVRAK